MDEKIWLQQKNENEKNYKLFVQFLKYEGSIANFADEQEQKSNSELKASAVKKIAQRHKWLIRRDACRINKPEINSSSFFQSIKHFETVVVKIFGFTLNEIDKRIDNGTFELPKGKELEYLKFVMTATDKLPGMIKLGYKYDVGNRENSLNNKEFTADNSLLDEDE
jgi:hypothetical protein